MPSSASLELKNEKQSAHSNWIASVAFSPNGNAIVSGSYDNAIKVWDAGASFVAHLRRLRPPLSTTDSRCLVQLLCS